MADTRAYRLTSIDMLRGLAIVVMAIDHARDFFLVDTVADPMKDPELAAPVFITRWITHFCAPVFTLLAGTSAGLMTARKGAGELGRFLLARGLWLVLVEVTLISLGNSFRPLGVPQIGGYYLAVLQTIWAIGASMIVLALLQRLGRRACLWIGVAIVAGHNALDGLLPVTVRGDTGPWWLALHNQLRWDLGPVRIVNFYPLLPWLGVMLVGFGSSALFELPNERRNLLLRRVGWALTAGFVLLRALDVYGDADHWQSQPGGLAATAMDFLNTTKYPPSLLFTLMTIGPAAVLCSYADRVTGGPLGRVKDVLVMFGRVPFAFYVAHFYLLHSMAIVIGVLQGFPVADMVTNHVFFPEGYGVSLWAVYALWALAIVLLYPLCRWMADLKGRRRDWWLSYV